MVQTRDGLQIAETPVLQIFLTKTSVSLRLFHNFCTLWIDHIKLFFFSYKLKDGVVENPIWVGSNKKYIPSHNKAPQSFCPILLHKRHFNTDEELKCDETTQYVLCCMRWGLIPNWFMG